MANVLSSLKEALGAGARASKYRVVFTFPNAVSVERDARNVDVLCKASSFPAMPSARTIALSFAEATITLFNKSLTLYLLPASRKA